MEQTRSASKRAGPLGTKDHECVLCGARYHSCDHCNQTGHVLSWKALTDTRDHYRIFHILCDFANGTVSAEKARELLSVFPTEDRTRYKKNYQALLERIFVRTPARTLEKAGQNQVFSHGREV